MTIFEKYPNFSKGRLTALIGRISKLYDEGKIESYIPEEVHLPVEMVKDILTIKKKALENKKK